MKLLIASPSQGHYGGIEAFVMALAAAAKAWPEFEIQVCFKLVGGHLLKDDLKSSAAKLGCPVHYVRKGSRELWQLIRWADVVHGQNTSPDIVFPARLLGKKLVLTIHNWRQHQWNAHFILWGLGARLAHRRWYNSHFVWDTWEPTKKLSGSDSVPTVCRLPEAWCAPDQRKGFIFMGRWIANKGLEELITAYAQANLDPSQWPLILVGDGPLKPQVMERLGRLNVTATLPGFVDDKTKGELLAASRWLIAPAKTREDLGLTPIEARSVGVPSIVTRDGGLPEAGGPSAMVVEPGDIAGLTAALQKATTMPQADYVARCEVARTSLKDFLRPMDFYRNAYVELLKG